MAPEPSTTDPCIGGLAVLSPKMGAQLLDALGLTGRPVVGLSLEFAAGDVARLVVREVLTDERAEALVPLLRHFALIEGVDTAVAPRA